MASGDAPPVKRLKIKDENDEIFMSFHKDNLQILKDALNLLNNSQSGYGFVVVKIKVCNAASSKCFSSATCDCEQFLKPSSSIPIGFKIRGIFQYGFKMLEAYTKSPECIPQRRGARLALAKLLKFLSDIELTGKTLSQGRKYISETEWTARVAHHLFSKLAVGSNYTLDNISKGRTKEAYCNCGCNERLLGDYGDTSMGVPSYWHGRLDILMDVAVTVATEDPDSPGAGNCSSCEMNITSERMIACKEQIRAEAIVFSFLQKKNHPELDNFLIPTIAMSKSQMAVCLYDCENDIFLETPCLDLFVGDTFLKEATIITLWLVLNFKYCCSGVPEEIMEFGFTADFFKHAGPHLDKYIADVKAPCCYQTEHTWSAVLNAVDVKEIPDDVNNIYQPS